jgi:hypothetical protein
MELQPIITLSGEMTRFASSSSSTFPAFLTATGLETRLSRHLSK